jgi:hypothetical protein
MVLEAVSVLELQARAVARNVFEDIVASPDFQHDRCLPEDAHTFTLCVCVFLSFKVWAPYIVL